MYFYKITGTYHTQFQAMNISYVIVNQNGEFSISIQEWNRLPHTNKTWINFKNLFNKYHRRLLPVTDITSKEVGVHHSNMVHDAVTRIQEVVLQVPLNEVPEKKSIPQTIVIKQHDETSCQLHHQDYNQQATTCCSTPTSNTILIYITVK